MLIVTGGLGVLSGPYMLLTGGLAAASGETEPQPGPDPIRATVHRLSRPNGGGSVVVRLDPDGRGAMP